MLYLLDNSNVLSCLIRLDCTFLSSQKYYSTQHDTCPSVNRQTCSDTP